MLIYVRVNQSEKNFVQFTKISNTKLLYWNGYLKKSKQNKL